MPFKKNMQKCRSLTRTSSISDHLSFDLQGWPWLSTWINVSNGIFTPQLQQIILKSMHKCRSYGPDKFNLWPFYNLTFKFDLDLQPTRPNVSNGTFAPQGKQLCRIIFKSMHKCRCYVPEQLNLWPFSHSTFKCNLELQPTWINNSYSSRKTTVLKMFFWNGRINVEVVARTCSIYDNLI